MSVEPDLVIHKIIISGKQQATFDINYDPLIYEGKWILNVFSYNFLEKKIYFEMTD